MKLGRFGEIDFGFLTFLYKKILNTRLFLALAVIALFAYCFTQIETTFTTIATTNSTVNIDSELKGGMVDMAKGLKDALLLIVGFFFMSKASEGGAKATSKASEEVEEESEEAPTSASGTTAKIPVATSTPTSTATPEAATEGPKT